MKFLLLLTVAMLRYCPQKSMGKAKVSLKCDKEGIARVLANIEKQSNFRFLYNNALESMKRKISINVHELGEISEVPDLFSCGTDLTYKMLDNNLIVVLSILPPFRTYKLRARSPAITEIPYRVSIALKESNRGTSTDNIGVFNHPGAPGRDTPGVVCGLSEPGSKSR